MLISMNRLKSKYTQVHHDQDQVPISVDMDIEKGQQGTKVPKSVVDIEHVPVDDDPREWSNLKKNLVLTMMTISVVRSLLQASSFPLSL
jgi:hypothetical protein